MFRWRYILVPLAIFTERVKEDDRADPYQQWISVRRVFAVFGFVLFSHELTPKVKD